MGVKFDLKNIINKLLLKNYENAHDTVTHFEKFKMYFDNWMLKLLIREETGISGPQKSTTAILGWSNWSAIDFFPWSADPARPDPAGRPTLRSVNPSF